MRIGSVDNGEKFMRDNANPVVPMPEGAKIFETVGAWEDYATPSRDMRLIIAMNVLSGLSDQVVRHPELYNLGGRKPMAVAEELRQLHARRARERGIEYRRSDGAAFKLTVAERWRARRRSRSPTTPTIASRRAGAPRRGRSRPRCRRATRPPISRRAWLDVRAWFHDAKRPPRADARHAPAALTRATRPPC